MFEVKAVARLFVFTAVTVFVAAVLGADKKERPYPHAYCIDPFASVDLGTAIYTDCKLVPMWSMKV